MASPIVPELSAVRVRAPAKINLALRVGPLRDDGYHPLATVYQALSLYDELDAGWAEPDVFEVAVSGEGADLVPADDDNLAVRAARLLAERYGPHDSLGVSLSIRKSIPVAGGLAGGSADAAAALLACAVLWDLDVDPNQLRELGAELGSDVPFALLGGTALGSGRGESLVPALARGTYHWVLAFAHHGLSTPAVYKRFDQLTAAGPEASPAGPVDPDQPFEVPAELMNALLSGDPRQLGRTLVNDLQAPALDLQPQLRRTVEAGQEYGALGTLVSGSGPTVVFLVENESAALDLTASLSADGVCRTVRRASGPVPGARVIG